MHTQVASPPRPAPRAPAAVPRVDLYEGERDFLLLADLPGVTRDTLTLEVERGELRLSAYTPPEHPLGARRWERRFQLSRGIRADDIHAELKDGVLRVTLPKAEVARKRSIEVQSA